MLIAESQGADVHAQRRNPGWRTETRTTGPGGQGDARADDRAAGSGVHQVHECTAAGDVPQGQTDPNLRGGRQRDHVLLHAFAADSEDRGLPAGRAHGDSAPAAVLPHRRAPRLRRGLPQEPGQVGDRGVGAPTIWLTGSHRLKNSILVSA